MSLLKTILRDVTWAHNIDHIFKFFDVRNSMNSKKSYGGTSSNNVKEMIKKYKKEIK